MSKRGRRNGSVNPDQTAPLGSGSTLFAQTGLSENLGSLRYDHCGNFPTKRVRRLTQISTTNLSSIF